MTIIKNATLIYPAIFSASIQFNGREKYSNVFEYDGDELEAAGMHRRGRENLYGANSQFAPEIHSMDAESDYTLLDEAYRLADLRNLSKNLLFKGLEVDLELEFGTITNPRTKEEIVTAAVRKVWIDEDAVLLRARHTITQEEIS